MDNREKEIRETLKKISSLAGDPPPHEDGPGELAVCCWDIADLVEKIVDQAETVWLEHS